MGVSVGNDVGAGNGLQMLICGVDKVVGVGEISPPDGAVTTDADGVATEVTG
ncbi:MAG: hypothetical protein NZ765_05690 [Anaerolineae bacterium]|nr:hypothetical protein [Anaerolineae bacterium]MDW8071080.1 hypothetical protein [Anaerolineae bacterium]